MAMIQALYTTGSSLYAVLVSDVDGSFWDAVALSWETYDSGHWARYAISVPEASGSGFYQVAYPGTAATVLSTSLIFAQAGGSPTLGDSPVTSQDALGVNVGALAGSVAQASKLAQASSGMVQGLAAAGVLTAAAFTTNLASSVTGAYQGRLCLFTSGVLAGQVGNVIGYDGSTKVVTVGGPFTAAPTAGDAFIIV